MIKPIINEVFADNGAHSHWELIDCNNGEILWSEQLATDGREELEKEATEQKEKQASLVKEIKQLQFDEAFLHTEITALQSSLKEKEKECEDKDRTNILLKKANDHLRSELNKKIGDFEELKAENERLKAKHQKELEEAYASGQNNVYDAMNR